MAAQRWCGLWQERQESLDKKAKECSAVTRKAGALENSCAQLKVRCEHGAAGCIHCATHCDCAVVGTRDTLIQLMSDDQLVVHVM